MTQYYDRFKPKDNWVQLLAVAGRRLQSAELNEIQSMLTHKDKLLGDVLLGQGNIIDGCQIYVNGNMARVSSGKAYLDGHILDVPEKEITITGVGEETIGLRLHYDIVSYERDPALLDPAVGAENYGLMGMDRKIARPEWVLNDPTAISVFRIENGQVVTQSTPPELEGITPILARRTYDTNGNFLASGMDGYIEEKDVERVTLVVEAGRAYVAGLQIDKLVPQRLTLPKSLESRTVINETKLYKTGNDEHILNSRPVKEIKTITATVEVTESVARGNIPGTTDKLPKNPVVDIVSIVAGGKTYVRGTDFQLSGNFVDWSLIGAEPAGGTTYQVTYRYTKVMVVGVDYKLEDNKVKFLSGDRPVKDSTFQITYDFFLARKDVCYLTSAGEIKVTQGQPNVYPSTPPIPPDVLSLNEIYFPPNGNAKEIKVTNYKPKRLTMLELRSLLERLERAEYNQAMENLDKEAQISDPSLSKKGIFTDNFTNFERSDITHPDFDAMLNPIENVLTLALDQTLAEMDINRENSTVAFHERLVTMPYVEEAIIDQSAATETWNVNPYSVFGNMATIRITPSQDTWVEQSHVTKTLFGWWSPWTDGPRSTTSMILDEQITHMRQRLVTVFGEGFEPDSDNIKATFDGVPVTLEPIGNTAAGTQPGTVRANSQGIANATFMIPAGIRSGTREVRLFNLV